MCAVLEILPSTYYAGEETRKREASARSVAEKEIVRVWADKKIGLPTLPSAHSGPIALYRHDHVLKTCVIPPKGEAVEQSGRLKRYSALRNARSHMKQILG